MEGETPQEDITYWDEPGVRQRTYGTIALGFGWAATVAIWWFVWGADATYYQNLSISISAAIILGGLISAIWMPGSEEREGSKVWEVHGFIVRVVWTMAVFLGIATVFAWWLWWSASDLTLTQNMGLYILIVAALVGLIAPVWIRWDKLLGASAPAVDEA